MTASPCADHHLLRVRTYDLDRICTELPGTSVERFERSRRRLCGLLSAFRVTDANSLLQALERWPSELSRYLKKLTWYMDIMTPLSLNDFPIIVDTAAKY